ncbi:Ethylene-responsive transcription factor WRI1 [Ananas comosus]|uniref:Ethylene-responsive transcription factor WRI1 n=1 Tax=Ananas comosus TaxID=4615 RepID=A0A199VL07_ANACO|nr:Ethylene-responsive transcription factor WRI1 [Ananas comosus]
MVKSSNDLRLVQPSKGVQGFAGLAVYLGAYDVEEAAARAYDLAALKYWGPTTYTNFPVSDYENELEIMKNATKEEYLASLRRWKSSGFSRGVSKYRGVARHHHNGRWEARIGRVFGNKYLYLGTYSTQEEAAHAYDIAAIEYRGINAVTNFDLSTYIKWLKPASSTLSVITQEQASMNQFSISESEIISSNNPFISDSMVSPYKQEFTLPQFHNNGGFGRRASPTALSLLLKSSMFRRLVEKNSKAVDEVGVFCEGIKVNAPYGCFSSTVDGAQSIKLQENLSYNYSSEQIIWDGAVSLSSMQ